MTALRDYLAGIVLIAVAVALWAWLMWPLAAFVAEVVL